MPHFVLTSSIFMLGLALILVLLTSIVIVLYEIHKASKKRF
ncbi:unnamed protein product [Paramecium octaurelia]|uniref:Uncharacterized protein n=1 Tax=Paramecium octaurelia TaxID=43137 RepID=A0A8S1WJT1_PAROT|nr:unnamed protein product [Paramecium octaurelia]